MTTDVKVNPREPHAFDDDGSGQSCTHCWLDPRHPRHDVAVEAAPTPALPYAGTSGYAGSETSHERAVDEDATGATGERQRRVLALLRAAGRHGMTWRELAVAEVWHHGQASGALSTLHKAGLITRLTGKGVRRERCEPYVLPEFVEDRPTAEHGRKAIDPDVTTYEEFRGVAANATSPVTSNRANVEQWLREQGGGRVVTRTHIVSAWADA